MSARPFLVAGQWRRTQRHHELFSPFDGRSLGHVCQGAPDDVEDALEAAHEIAPALACQPAWQRAEILERLRGLVQRDAEVLSLLISDEAGKPITQARGEVRRAIDTLSDAIVVARTHTGAMEPLEGLASGEGRIGWVRRVPVGPVTAITPYNFPLNLVVHKVAPAIAVGCPVLVKPAPHTPSVALHFAELVLEAGWHPKALSVLPVSNADASALVTDPRVRFVSFTGSAAVGWTLRAQAAHCGSALELGGTAANVIAPDADLSHAARRIAAAGFSFAGQSCISVQQVYVHHTVWEEFVSRLKDETAALVVGDPSDPATHVGPVLRDSDAERITQWVDEALAEGAQLLSGGGRTGRLLSPALLAHVPTHCRLWKEEVFGPVVCLRKYTDEQRVIEEINASPFGLQAGVFTNDLQRMLHLHQHLQVGGIVHNDASAFRVDSMPYGGTKGSGIGREGPRYAAMDFTEERILILRKD